MPLRKLNKAIEIDRESSESASFQAVIFQIEGEFFGIDIFKIGEIIRIPEITKVPKSLPFVEGVIDLRGRVIPIVDLRKHFGFPEIDYGRLGRIIIVRVAGFRLGLIVDAVTQVARIPREKMEPVPPSTVQIDAEYISGVGHLDDMLVILIDLDKILTDKEQLSLGGKKKKRQEQNKNE